MRIHHAFALWAAAIAPALVLMGCNDPEVRAKSTESPPSGEVQLSPELMRGGQVQVESVSRSAEAVTVRTSGKAGFDQEHLSYVSSPLVGRVVDLHARPGQHVTQGDSLAVIDSPDLGSASSEFIKARADLLLAERSYKLAQELSAAKAMARKDFQKAEDEFVKAKADLRRTRERLVSLGVPEAELDKPLDALHVRSQFNLPAPLSGTVVERSVTLGQMVGSDAAQRLFVIADLTTLWVTADIYEKDLSLIRPGQNVGVQAAAWPQETFAGHIDYVGDTVDPATRTIKVRLSVDNRRLLLKPEMFVTVAVETGGNATVLSVPVAAVHGEAAGQPYVFLAVDGDRFVRHAVTLGARLGDAVAIASGLNEHDRVVTEGSLLLKAEADRQANG